MSEQARHRQLITAWILRVSIGLCLSLIVTGLGLFLWSGERVPVTPGGSLLSMISSAVQRGSGGLLDLGVIVLLLTPVARLIAGVYVSARARDWLYAMIGVVVLGLVITGLIAGENGL